MLTKADLKQIRGVIREEIETEAEDIKQEFQSGQIRIRIEVSEVKNKIKNLEIKTTKVEKGINGLKTETRKLRRDVKTAISFFDKQSISSEKRLYRIEENLDLPTIVV